MENHLANVSFSSKTRIAARGFEWPDSLWFNLFVAGVVGFFYALYLFGLDRLDPRNVSWVHGDSATYYISWALYRQDPHWHFPLTFTDRLGYPIGDSIALMDVNPLLAVLFKLLSPLLPDPFQYLGIEVILSCALQFFFAMRLFRLVLGSNPFAVLVPSIFFLLAPPLNLRLVTHFALANQWLLTAAILLFCLANWDPPISRKRFAALAVLLAGVSIATNPYLAFQVLLVLGATVIGLWWRRRLTLPWAAGVLGALGVASLAAAACFGFIISGGRGYAGGGYRAYSMNLVGPFNPNGYGSTFTRQLPFFAIGQYEGYCYLGAGVILLALIMAPVVVWRRSQSPALSWRAATPLLICFFVLTMMALSTRVTFGSKLIIDFDPSQKLTPYLSVLRSSGRLFWMPYYAALATLLILPFVFLSRRWASALLGIVLVVQLIDLRPLQRWARYSANNTFETPLKSPVWSKLGARYQNLLIMPPWQCAENDSPWGMDGADIFGLLAAQQKMRTNSYRSGRTTGRELSYHCGALLSTFAHQPLSPSSVYVVMPQTAAVIVAGLGKCHNVDRYALCSANDDFGLGNAQWEPQTQFWIRTHFRIMLLRDPTTKELSDWTARLNQDPQSLSSFFAGLLGSSEFQQRSLPRFWAYLDARHQWPTRIEWMKMSAAGPAPGAANNERDHSPAERDRALVYMLYFAIFERDPDPYGISSWPASLAKSSLRTVASVLLNSPEYQSHEYLHYR